MFRLLSNSHNQNRLFGSIDKMFGCQFLSNSSQDRVELVLELATDLKPASDKTILDLFRHFESRQHQCELDDLLPFVYALVREASRRVHRQEHYEVQVLAGIKMAYGHIVEMQTGEGKTLASLLPIALYAMQGRGCHVVTANDYLAQRDAKFAQSVFEKLGMNVGCVFDGLPRDERRSEYEKSITYGTAREFGFDFLKDCIANHNESRVIRRFMGRDEKSVQREHFFALVDEADHVLIDDAITPLIIAQTSKNCELNNQLVKKCDYVSSSLAVDKDFELDAQKNSATLTKTGCRAVLKSLPTGLLSQFGTEKIFSQTECSLVANFLFHQDRNYVVKNNEVAIIDASTGRLADGRKWQAGLHQAIEVKESLPITNGTETIARTTIQSYFRKYKYLAGLTGTAKSAASEFKEVYDCKVASIPTRKRCQRLEEPTRIFETFNEKAGAVVASTKLELGQGRAVLIGTPSVQESLRISESLTDAGIEHSVLNCHNHAAESDIISCAGHAGQVTVATNMAGRGTDIKVAQSVLDRGGLHVISTARHISSRIDRQLIGRTARQGEPGSFQFLLSMEDELFSNLINSTSTKVYFRKFNSEYVDKFQKKVERESFTKRMKMNSIDRLKALQLAKIGLQNEFEFTD